MPGYGIPKPDGQRRRRNATVPMLQLPAGGRKGAPPKWPDGRPTPRQRELWRELWKTPMAAAWERLGFERTVARYVCVTAMADDGRFRAPLYAELRQLEDRLGLNPLSLLRLRWEVSTDELAELRADKAPRVRPKAVDPGAVAGAD